jgi:hypothetical protein
MKQLKNFEDFKNAIATNKEIYIINWDKNENGEIEFRKSFSLWFPRKNVSITDFTEDNTSEYFKLGCLFYTEPIILEFTKTI